MSETTEWERSKKNVEVVNTQMDQKEMVQVVKSLETLEKWLKEVNNVSLQLNWKLAPRSSAKEVDM